MTGKNVLLAAMIIMLIMASGLDVNFYDRGRVKQKTTREYVNTTVKIEIWDHATAGTKLYTKDGTATNGRWNIAVGPVELEYGRQYWKEYTIGGEDADFNGEERQPFYALHGGIKTGYLITDTSADLVVDTATHRVGINEASPGSTLDVDGTFAVSGNVAVNIDKVTIDASNGNTAIAGTLTVGTVNEKTTDAGVTIEGAVVKDNTVTATTAYATTLDTNVAEAGVTLTGTTLAADGIDTNINIAITPKGSGEVDITKVDIDSGTVDAITSLTIANDVDVGDYQILAKTFQSDIATGTAPLTVASSTVVTNLNADKIDGQDAPSGTIVGTSDSQTLTNKVLTSPDINGGTVDAITSLTIANNVDVGDYQIWAKSFKSDVTTGTAPLTVASTTVVTNLNSDKLDGQDAPSGTIVGTSDSQTLTNKVLTSPDINGGTVDAITSLTIANNVDVGDYQILAKTFQSDIATGTAPLTVASTTVVTNLNADKLDGQDAPSGTIVGTSDSQTLTNKVLTSPDINGGTVDAITSLTIANDVDIGDYKVLAKTFQSDITTGTAPLTVASTTVVTNLNADKVDGKDESAFVLADGTRVLSANWDAGSYEIRAETFESDVITGTAPLTVASTTVVTNLNADKLDGQNAPSGTIVGTSDSQTLTNKVLTSPDINGGTVDAITSLTIANDVDVGDYQIWAKSFKSDVTTGTAPLTVASTTVVTNLNADRVDGKDESAFVLADGTRVLSANWDAGSFEIRAETFESDVTTGTAPLTVASTTVVTNLNADRVDGKEESAFVLADGTRVLSANWDAGSYEIRAETFESDVITGTAPLTVASTTVVTNLNADKLDGQNAPSGTIVGTSDSQTLTNKVLTSPDINGGTVDVITSLTIANDVDVGDYQIWAKSFKSDVTTGTAPLTVASTTVVTNLNADKLDGKDAPTGDIVGTSDTQTLSGKTLTAPKFADGGYIADDAGLELIKFSKTATAVNEITIANAATGNGPTISATGETNVDLNIGAKGTGLISAGSIVKLNNADTPTTCAAGLEGAIYYDSGDNELCVCSDRSTSYRWERVSDPTVACVVA